MLSLDFVFVFVFVFSKSFFLNAKAYVCIFCGTDWTVIAFCNLDVWARAVERFWCSHLKWNFIVVTGVICYKRCSPNSLMSSKVSRILIDWNKNLSRVDFYYTFDWIKLAVNDISSIKSSQNRAKMVNSFIQLRMTTFFTLSSIPIAFD